MKDVQYLVHKVRNHFNASLDMLKDEQYKFHQHMLEKINDHVMTKSDFTQEAHGQFSNLLNSFLIRF